MKLIFPILAALLAGFLLSSHLVAKSNPAAAAPSDMKAIYYNSEDGKAVVTLLLSTGGVTNDALGSRVDVHLANVEEDLGMVAAGFHSMGFSSQIAGPQVVDFGDLMVTLVPKVSWDSVAHKEDLLVTIERADIGD